MDAWAEHELAGGTFPDLRLKSRLGRLLGDLGERIGGTLPMACQDWAVTTDGRPLGLAAVKFWSRKGFKNTNVRKRTINPTTVPIEQKESVRWLENVTRSTQELGDPDWCVHVGDREADIFELFHAAHDARAHFLVRTAVDRLARRGATTVAKVMRRQPIRGVHEVEVRDDHGNVSTATVQVRFCRLTIHPSPAKRKRYGPLSLTVLHAIERGRPRGREPIRWKLLTDLPVEDLTAAVEKLNWYAMRGQVEKSQADCTSSRRWVGTGRIGYHRRDGVAGVGRVVPATPG